MLDFIYTLLIAPLEYWMHAALVWGYSHTEAWGPAIVVMSLAVNVVILPIYIKAEKWQEGERALRKSFEAKEAMIKRTFKGQERFAMISTMHRQAGYSPFLSLRSSLGFFLQIPFFFAAYHFLSHFEPLAGVSFLGIADLFQARRHDQSRCVFSQRAADSHDRHQSGKRARLYAQHDAPRQDAALRHGSGLSGVAIRRGKRSGALLDMQQHLFVGKEHRLQSARARAEARSGNFWRGTRPLCASINGSLPRRVPIRCAADVLGRCRHSGASIEQSGVFCAGEHQKRPFRFRLTLPISPALSSPLCWP